MSSWFETTDGDIVDNFFNFLDVVLEGVVFPPESVVLEVEQPEAGRQLRHKPSDGKGPLTVPQYHTVYRQSGLGGGGMTCKIMFAYMVYSGTPLIRTSEMRTPRFSGHLARKLRNVSPLLLYILTP